jgi:uroporphyrin-3 C-methyltransferase
VIPTSDDVTPRRRARTWTWLVLLLVLVALGAAAAFGWQWWQQHQAAQAAEADAVVQLEALDARVDALRRDHRAQAQRLQRADATNRVLRDELLGLGERSAIIEDSFARFADPDRHGAQALRLDEAELLLSLGQQRLLIAGDLDGARRAYALAAGVLAGVDDPAYLSLRQTLMQERTALDALDAEPRAQALARLESFTAAIDAPAPRTRVVPATEAPWWRRAFGGIVQVQPSNAAVAVQPADVVAARAGLQLEVSLARAAAERRDVESWQAALSRAGDWLARLEPDRDVLASHRARLDRLAAAPLSLTLPTLGTTLAQLRQLRAASEEPRR